MLATLIQTLDSTIANVALPHMQGTLSASQDEITWVLTSYIVAAAIATPLTGWLSDQMGVKKLLATLKQDFPQMYQRIRFPETSGIGLKPVSKDGSERLIRAAIAYALREGRKSLTLVHKGNIMKFTEGAFKDWGYALAAREFRNDTVSERETWILGNKEANASLTAEANARMIDPGFDMMTPEQRTKIVAEVEIGR